MRTNTHYAINYSDACDEGGSGICDGEVPSGEGNRNALSDECTCKCHTADDLPQTIEGVKAWHDSWHGLDAMDAHGNAVAEEGCTRCVCGAKYWENDRCIDCHRHAITVEAIMIVRNGLAQFA